MTADAVARWAAADLELERVFTAWQTGQATRGEYDEAIAAAAQARLEATRVTP